MIFLLLIYKIIREIYFPHSVIYNGNRVLRLNIPRSYKNGIPTFGGKHIYMYIEVKMELKTFSHVVSKSDF